MTKEHIINKLNYQNKMFFGGQNETLNEAIKALEQNNEEIFKQFKRKAFYESEDILGTDMVDTYMITDYLAKLLGVEDD